MPRSAITTALAAGDYLLRDHTIDGVRPIDPATAEAIAKEHFRLGRQLRSLALVYMGPLNLPLMEGYWQLLVDPTMMMSG